MPRIDLDRLRPRGSARHLRVVLFASLFAVPIAARAFDLVPIALTRTNEDVAGLPATPVRVRVVVANAAKTDMPAAVVQSGWTVQVQGYSLNPYVVRRALAAGEWHSFAIPVVVPCGKVTDLEVRVNASRGLSEANFDNNSVTFPVRGNACPATVRPVQPDHPAARSATVPR
ncbi:MAG: hypothetical protein HC872_06545 [Gammaproteobacteria bacterium]|nr:hypothetical protein [Gammaproteobacteria bacterium]